MYIFEDKMTKYQSVWLVISFCSVGLNETFDMHFEERDEIDIQMTLHLIPLRFLSFGSIWLLKKVISAVMHSAKYFSSAIY